MEDSSHSFSTLRILSQSKSGYIGQCNCCDHYNFAFGNLLFTFTEDGLRGFYGMLHEHSQSHTLDSPLPHGRNVVFPSPIPNFMLSFTEQELEEAKGMFQETFLVREVDKIFLSKK